MIILKKKSLVKDIHDDKIDSLCVTRFISFESAIEMFYKYYNINEKAIGYIIAEEGIIIKTS